jgi:hypothetical protein
MQRNFVQFAQAAQLAPTERSAGAMNTLASQMLA